MWLKKPFNELGKEKITFGLSLRVEFACLLQTHIEKFHLFSIQRKETALTRTDNIIYRKLSHEKSTNTI